MGAVLLPLQVTVAPRGGRSIPYLHILIGNYSLPTFMVVGQGENKSTITEHARLVSHFLTSQLIKGYPANYLTLSRR
jgi:hypothetical protein